MGLKRKRKNEDFEKTGELEKLTHCTLQVWHQLALSKNQWEKVQLKTISKSFSVIKYKICYLNIVKYQ